MSAQPTYSPAPTAKSGRSFPPSHAPSSGGPSLGLNWKAWATVAGAVALGLLVVVFVIRPVIAMQLFFLGLLFVLVLATLTLIVSHIYILVRAAGEDLGELALCLCVPGYIIYYVVSRWDESHLLGRIYFGSYAVHIAIYALFITLGCLLDLN